MTVTDRVPEAHEFVAGEPRDPALLALSLELVGLEPGQSRFSFTLPHDSVLLATHLSTGQALASVRDVLVRELDSAIQAFRDHD